MTFPLQVSYVWSGASPVSVGELAINDYMFISQTVGSGNITSKLGTSQPQSSSSNIPIFLSGCQSSLYMEFTFSRTIGYYFMRTYFPLMIITASSWVSFWLVRTPAGGEIVARVGLGITCCLGEN